jgi:sulfur-carrier protein adenylyltransferase/sulfurtransferase
MGELNSLTELEKKRYKLQIMLPGIGADGQEKIKNARVLVVGIGGLGSLALQYLTAMGVGTLGFLDYDLIEEENLSHQVLYGMDDIGKLKAVITRKRLRGMNPLIQFNMLNVQLNQDNAGAILPSYDIVVDATNNKEAHYLINDSCLKYGKVMVYGCVCKMEGRLSVFNYKDGPSFRCAWPVDDESNTPGERRLSGMPGILPGITGSYLANEVGKIITGSPGILSGMVMFINVFDYQNRFVEVKKDLSNFNY